MQTLTYLKHRRTTAIMAVLVTTACGSSTPTTPTAVTTPERSGAPIAAAGVINASATTATITALKHGGSGSSSSTGPNPSAEPRASDDSPSSSTPNSNSGSNSGGGSTANSGPNSNSGPGSVNSGRSENAVTAGTTPTSSSSRDRTAIQAEGIVTSVTGRCPDLRVSVGADNFATTALTDFQRGGCARVVPGARVHIAAALIDGTPTAVVVRVQERIADGPDDGRLGDDSPDTPSMDDGDSREDDSSDDVSVDDASSDTGVDPALVRADR